MKHHTNLPLLLWPIVHTECMLFSSVGTLIAIPPKKRSATCKLARVECQWVVCSVLCGTSGRVPVVLCYESLRYWCIYVTLSHATSRYERNVTDTSRHVTLRHATSRNVTQRDAGSHATSHTRHVTSRLFRMTCHYYGDEGATATTC